MNLDEAIENLEEESQFEQEKENHEMVDSIQLGIEAIKRELSRRQHLNRDFWVALPGETRGE